MREMTALLIVLILFITLLCTFAYAKEDFIIVEKKCFEGVIIPENQAQKFFPASDRVQIYWTPTKKDVLAAEEKIIAYLQGNKPARSPNLWENLNNYKRQYLGFVENNKKKIWMNFFSSDFIKTGKINWKKEPVYVLDGGDKFFNITYDIETGEFSDLEINGEA